MTEDSKNDMILKHILDTKVSIASIDEHLKNLNSKVSTNVSNIEKNRTDNTNTRLTISKWGGSLVATFLIASTAFNYFFK